MAGASSHRRQSGAVTPTLGAKDDTTEVHLNFTAADNRVGVTAAAPVQLLDLNWSNSFTSPQITDNKVTMVSLNGLVKATPTLTFSGVSYYRWFQQKHIDGNIADAEDCPNPFGGLPDPVVCFEGDDPLNPDPVIGPGDRVQEFIDEVAYGTLDRTSQNANSWGVSGQGVEKAPILGLHNQFLLGASYDHGRVGYASSSELGVFGPGTISSRSRCLRLFSFCHPMIRSRAI